MTSWLHAIYINPRITHRHGSASWVRAVWIGGAR
jgi:hypothetical protein